MKKEISVKMENCECVIGKSTKKHNTVSMRVSNKDIIDVLELYEAEKRGEKPEDGIIGLRLVAVYADEMMNDGSGDGRQKSILLSSTNNKTEPDHIINSDGTRHDVSSYATTGTKPTNGDELIDQMNNELDEVLE